MDTANSNKGTKQPKRVSPISGTPPPDGFEKYPERRHNGAWRKEDTARFKLEQMLKLDEKELQIVAEDKDAPFFERRLAKSLLNEREFKTTEAMINQVYGAPKQVQETKLEAEATISGIEVTFRDESRADK